MSFCLLLFCLSVYLPLQVPSVSVSWGGVTVVERTLALMQKATEVDSSWRFFVNLGHVSDGLQEHI